DDVERARGQQADFERYHAAALSRPFGGAGGNDGQIFDRGFMALRPVSQSGGKRDMAKEEAGAVGAKEPEKGAETSGEDVLSSAAATAGSPEASSSPTSDTSPRLTADTATPETGGMGGAASSLEPNGGNSGGMAASSPSVPSDRGGGRSQPELLGVEITQEQDSVLPPDPVPDLVHAPEGEPIPPGARIWKGRVYQPEPRQTRSQSRTQDAPPMVTTSGPALVLQFASPNSTSGMTREEARARGMAPGMMTVRQAQEDILRVVYDEPDPDISPEDLP
ncbi:unnamed protein product, partial [Scytosiphon promiscuus]